MHQKKDQWVATRRDFLKTSGLVAIGHLIFPGMTTSQPASLCRFGIVTDLHSADIETRHTRFYRDSIEKMEECISFMNGENLDFMIELGDLTNGTSDGDLRHLEKIESVYSKFNGPRYHVIGNHDVDSLSKKQFQSVITNSGISPELTYYSFDRNNIHFIVLDGNYRSDGSPYDRGNFDWTDSNIPEEQLKWLKSDLDNTKLPTIICIHQPLDTKKEKREEFLKNASVVRNIIELHPNVLAVLQGHRHKGHYSRIQGIHYYTLRAMVLDSGLENNSFAVVEVHEDMSISITGYRKAFSVIG